MTKRRDLWKAAAATALLPFAAANGASLPNVTMDAKQAKLTREPFGDLTSTSRAPPINSNR